MMIGLSGSLQAVGFQGLVGFLAGLGKTGTLRIRHEQWIGEVVFERGEVVAAALGEEQGTAALEAIALALPVGEFQFAEAEPGLRTLSDRNLSLSPPALQSFLEGLQHQRPVPLPVALTPATVPFVVHGDPTPLGPQDAPRVALTRGAIQTLLSVDGQRTVAEIAEGRGLGETIRDLEALVRHGLIGVPAPAPAGTTVATPPFETGWPPAPPAVAGQEPSAAPAAGSVEPQPSIVGGGSPAMNAAVPVGSAVAATEAAAPSPPDGTATPGQAAPMPVESVVSVEAVALKLPAAPVAPEDKEGARDAAVVDEGDRRAAEAPDTAGPASPREREATQGPQATHTSQDTQDTQGTRVIFTPATAVQPSGRAAGVPSTGVPSTGVPSTGVPSTDRAGATALPARLVASRLTSEAQTDDACPMLGFADDPRSHFSRATQLHRCFASMEPQRIAAGDQQALCLTTEFPACARYTVARSAPRSAPDNLRPRDAVPDVAPAPRARGAAGRTESRSATPVPGEARREAPDVAESPAGDKQREEPSSTTGRGPARPAAPLGDQNGQPRGGRPGRELPDRVNSDSPDGGAAHRNGELVPVASGAAATAATAASVDSRAPATAPDRPLSPLLRVTRMQVLLVVLVLAIGAALLLPLLMRPPDSVTVQLAPGPAVGSPGATGGTPAAAGAATAVPTPGALRTVFDDRFVSSQSSWPNSADGVAFFADGAYRLAARRPGQFVAIGAPIRERFKDVVVTGVFRKVGGPAGGGYGLIVRDQGPGARDGANQTGRFYVFETGDKGEYGIWRREGDAWVDIVPWTASTAVAPNNGQNTLSVQAIGSQLTFFVNGQRVASQTDATLQDGAVGIFAGGDGNEVVIERFLVQVPGS